MKRPVFSMGVDLGGTSMRVQAVDSALKPLANFKSPAPTPAQLPDELAKLWKSWKVGRPNYLTVASKGVWNPRDRQTLQKQLKSFARQVVVLSDIELAFESAFTPKGESPAKTCGVLVLGGTGSIAFGRDSSGRVARAGGFGPSLGDEGSGFWMGKEYMRLVAVSRTQNTWIRDLVRSQDSVFRIAALAKVVLKKARKEKPCANIVRMAQTHLAELVMGVVQKLQFDNKVPVSWSGGLFRDKFFYKGFWELLSDLNPKVKFTVVKPRQEPVSAAARWGGIIRPEPLNHFGYTVSESR